MSEKPILFSGPMVAAILSGRKSQTRRVVKPQPRREDTPSGPMYEITGSGGLFAEHVTAGCMSKLLACPYGKPGVDRLWVRENWQQITPGGRAGQWHTVDTPCEGLPHRRLLYAATCNEEDPPRWRPSIHMPRWASRITLEIVAVRVERLQEISENDCYAEGVSDEWPIAGMPYLSGHGGRAVKNNYANLWDTINGKRPGCAWKDDPFMWVIEFKRAAEASGEGR